MKPLLHCSILFLIAAAATAQNGSVRYYGIGCPFFPFQIDGAPNLGQSITIETYSSFRPRRAVSAVTVWFGFSDQAWGNRALPLPLTQLNRTWICGDLLQSMDVRLDSPASANPIARIPVNIPNDPALAGLTVYAQAVQLTYGGLGASGLYSTAVSRGASITIGR